ncbi:MAG TPA: hypothetical protein VF798_08540 [Burkholderiaceae bacterium]
MPRTILIPIPNHDFDPSEVAVPWKILRSAGHRVLFAPPDGRQGYPDPIMLSDIGLDPWGWIPGLKELRVIGLMLRADANARAAYGELERDAGFRARRPRSFGTLVRRRAFFRPTICRHAG